MNLSTSACATNHRRDTASVVPTRLTRTSRSVPTAQLPLETEHSVLFSPPQTHCLTKPPLPSTLRKQPPTGAITKSLAWRRPSQPNKRPEDATTRLSLLNPIGGMWLCDCSVDLDRSWLSRYRCSCGILTALRAYTLFDFAAYNLWLCYCRCSF